MPYLQVELDAKKRMLKAAKAAGVPVGEIAWGLLELWEHAWESKRDVVGQLVLDGCLGANDRLRDALVAFDFLEPVDVGYRIRGADRYLRIHAAQSAAGKLRATNLRRGGSESSPAPLPAKPEVEPETSSGSVPALTPSTEHRAPIEESKPLSTSSTAVREVFAHWQQVMGKQRAKLDSARESKVEARLRDGYTADDLKAAIDGCAKTPHNMGENDRGERYDDLTLICRDAAHVERFMARAKGSATQAKPVIPPPRQVAKVPEFFEIPSERAAR